MFNVGGLACKGVVGMASRIFSAMSQAGVSVIFNYAIFFRIQRKFCVSVKAVETARSALEAEFEQN